MPEERPYQQQFIADAYASAEESNIVLGVMACGLGKLTVASQMIVDHIEAGLRSYFIVNLDCLIDQAHDRMVAAGVPEDQIGFIKAGHKEKRSALVQIASIQTMLRREWFYNYPPDFAVWDECHLVWSHKLAKKLLALWRECFHFGNTATPWRMSRKDSLLFQTQALVCGPTPQWAIENGYLVPTDYYSLRDAQADLNGVRIVRGDYDLATLAARTDREELIEKMVANWRRFAEGKRTGIFTVNVAHSHHVAEVFCSHGITAAAIDGKTSQAERRRLYAEFRAGTTLVLVSCGVLSVGFDEPAMECAILARASKSVSLIWQQIGRAQRTSRPTGKKRAIVLDMAGVLTRLPVPESLTHYALQAPPEGGGGAGGSVKPCPTVEETGCPGMSWGFEKTCCVCGAEFPPAIADDHDGELSRLVLADNDRAEKAERRLKKSLGKYKKQALKFGRDPSWASKAFFSEHRTAPLQVWHLGAVFGEEPSDADGQAFALYLEQVRRRRGLDRTWLELRMEEEFGDRLNWRPVLEDMAGMGLVA